MRKHKSVFVFVFMFCLLGMGLLLRIQHAQALPTDANAADGELQSASDFAPDAVQIHLDYSDTIPDLTPAQAKALEAALNQGPKPGPALPTGDSAVERFDSAFDPSTQTLPPSTDNTLNAPESPDAPGSWSIPRNTILTNLKTYSSRVGEPTVANSGSIVFATGNWWAALSKDGGKTFAYVNPFSMFPSSFGGFCCDQIVIYEPSRDIFIWYLQYLSSGSPGSGQNLFRVAVARPKDAAQGNWWYYDFTSASNTEYDYPDMCLSNDYLWITTNRGAFNGTTVNTAFLFKFPLDPLSTGAGFSYSWIDLLAGGLNNLSLRCTRGAHETMYFGSHNTLSQVRVFRWPENSGSLNWNDVNLSAAWFNNTHACPGPDGRSWCGFDDGRIKAGWVSRGQIGFMWGSAQGGGFPYPYVEALRVRESDRAYIDRPFLWTNSAAFAYPAAAPNARGDVGIAFAFGGGIYYPYFGIGIDDDFSRDSGNTPPPWDVWYLRQSTQGPTSNRWGDYFSVQPFAPTGLGWTAAGFTMQGCGGNYCTEPSYTIFGRERDLRSITNYYDATFGLFLPSITK